eukprot:2534009-Rhodomonas_salina.2
MPMPKPSPRREQQHGGKSVTNISSIENRARAALQEDRAALIALQRELQQELNVAWKNEDELRQQLHEVLLAVLVQL